MNDISFIETKHGGNLVRYKNNLFRKERKRDNLSYWKCSSDSKCKARIVLLKDVCTYSTGFHTHEPAIKENHQKALSSNLKERAIMEVTVPDPRKNKEEVADTAISNEEASRLLKFKTAKKIMNKERSTVKPPLPVTFIESKRGGNLVQYQNYLFHMEKKRENISYWKCASDPKCKARIVLLNDIIKSSFDFHTHEPAIKKIQKKAIYSILKERAIVERTVPVSRIYNEVARTAASSELASFVPKFKTAESIMYRARSSVKPPLPVPIKDKNLSESLKITKNDDNFLPMDNGFEGNSMLATLPTTSDLNQEPEENILTEQPKNEDHRNVKVEDLNQEPEENFLTKQPNNEDHRNVRVEDLNQEPEENILTEQPNNEDHRNVTVEEDSFSDFESSCCHCQVKRMMAQQGQKSRKDDPETATERKREASTSLSSNKEKVTFIKSARNGKLVQYQNYLFRLERKRENISYWKCKSNLKCKARIVLLEDNFKSSSGSHTHEPPMKEIQQKTINSILKARAMIDVTVPVSRIYKEVAHTAASSELASCLPKYKTAEKIMYKARSSVRPPLRVTKKDINLSESSKKTKNDDVFLLDNCDEEDRMLATLPTTSDLNQEQEESILAEQSKNEDQKNCYYEGNIKTTQLGQKSRKNAAKTVRKRRKDSTSLTSSKEKAKTKDIEPKTSGNNSEMEVCAVPSNALQHIDPNIAVICKESSKCLVATIKEETDTPEGSQQQNLTENLDQMKEENYSSS